MAVSKVRKQAITALARKTIMYRCVSVYHCFLKYEASLIYIIGLLGLFQHHLHGERWN